MSNVQDRTIDPLYEATRQRALAAIKDRENAAKFQEVDAAYRAGRRAADRGLWITACPHAAGTPLHNEWLRGFDDGEGFG